ncbi:TM201 protein, partial [Atractosteus spatula]|nr:TM201 protein [Atractosteus spatula]
KKPTHVQVNCWFCSQDTVVPYGNRNCWDCPNCEQYNGFQENGDYNKPIPAQYMEHLNHGVSAGLPVPQTPKTLQFVNCQMLLCKKCNNNQTLKIKQLASFAPREEEVTKANCSLREKGRAAFSWPGQGLQLQNENRVGVLMSARGPVRIRAIRRLRGIRYHRILMHQRLALMFVNEKYDEEIEVYRHHIEQTYKLCRPCQTAVEYYIKHQNRQLRALLFSHQLRRGRDADKAFVQASAMLARP